LRLFIEISVNRSVLINEIAIKLGVKKVILAIDCTKLTIQLLSNVAQGKAAHLSSEMVCFYARIIFFPPILKLFLN
jgi:hypothetical protein